MSKANFDPCRPLVFRRKPPELFIYKDAFLERMDADGEFKFRDPVNKRAYRAMPDCDGDDCEVNLRVDVYTYTERPNLRYELELKEYNLAKERDDADLVDWKRQKAAYDLVRAAEAEGRERKEYERLKAKYSSPERGT